MTDITDILKAMKPSETEEVKAEAKPEKETKPKKAEAKKPAPDQSGLKPEGKGKKGERKALAHAYDSVVRHTEKATLFRVNDLCFWLPKSKYWTEDDTKDTVFAPAWLEVSLKQYRGK